jgi:hypothetical protein
VIKADASKRPTAYARRRLATRVFRDSVRNGEGCKWTWTGWVDGDGVATIRDFPYRRKAQHAAYEIKGERLWPGDRVISTCGDPHCMDGSHLRVIPLRPYRAPPKPRAKAIPTSAN